MRPLALLTKKLYQQKLSPLLMLSKVSSTGARKRRTAIQIRATITAAKIALRPDFKTKQSQITDISLQNITHTLGVTKIKRLTRNIIQIRTAEEVNIKTRNVLITQIVIFRIQIGCIQSKATFQRQTSKRLKHVFEALRYNEYAFHLNNLNFVYFTYGQKQIALLVDSVASIIAFYSVCQKPKK